MRQHSSGDQTGRRIEIKTTHGVRQALSQTDPIPLNHHH
jgi:hypothetical protein